MRASASRFSVAPVLAVGSLLGLVFGLLSVLPGCADAAPKCGGLHWVERDGVRINAAHVFCGELKDGRPKGFHSLALKRSAAERLIRPPLTRVQPRRGGIYAARVDFRSGVHKTSTFFPDHCEYDQVINSIAYAAKHQTGPAKPWGVLGPSAPKGGQAGGGYCLDDDAEPFVLRMGLLTRGRNAGSVNTAFPR